LTRDADPYTYVYTYIERVRERERETTNWETNTVDLFFCDEHCFEITYNVCVAQLFIFCVCVFECMDTKSLDRFRKSSAVKIIDGQHGYFLIVFVV